MKSHLERLAHRYIGGITHAHTVLSNHPGHRESDLTVDRIVQTLRDGGMVGEAKDALQYIMLNEHPSDPTHPHKLGRLSLRGRRLLKQRRRPVVGRLPVLYGLEVSLMTGGRTDLTPRLGDRCALVIASRHGLPDKIQHTSDGINELFLDACDNPTIEVIGHPPRYAEDKEDIDWAQIFRRAKKTGTAIEINLNSFPKAGAHRIQLQFWPIWLELLAESGAQVFIGTDLHNQLQLDTFIAEWHGLKSGASKHDNHLAAFLEAMGSARIDPELVVTANFENLLVWLEHDKAGRAHDMLRKR